VGHIGILGVDKKGAEFYQVLLGGSQGNAASLGTILGPSFAHDEIPGVIATILDIYVTRRESGESFLEFVRRVGIEPFRESVYAKPARS
jgi:sulfite reductase (NADPH) hemoprotein beta-component